MAVIKIDGYDIYQYTRVAPGDGLDIADADFIDPQFGDSAAGIGNPLLSVKANNRELQVPVHLKSVTNKDGLHQLVSDLNRRLANAQVLEWKDDGATNSSFMDIEFARFEPEFNKRRQDAGWMSGTVRIYTRPYARKVASGYAAFLGTGVATGVVGSIAMPTSYSSDGPLALRWQVTTPSAVERLTNGRIVGAAIVPSGYIVDWPAASITALNGAVLTGASGAAGSQTLSYTYLDISGQTTGRKYIDTSPFAQLVLPNASVYAGRNRVLAVAQTRALGYPIGMMDTRGEWVQYPAAPSSMPGYGFTTVDLGVVNVDPAVSPTAAITIRPFPLVQPTLATLDGPRTEWTVNSSSINGTKAFGPDFVLNRLLVIPEDNSQIILDNSGRRELGGMDTYGRYPSMPFSIDDLGNSATALVGSGIATGPLSLGFDVLGSYKNAGYQDGANIINTPTTSNLSISADIQHVNMTSRQVYSIGKWCNDNQSFAARIFLPGVASNASGCMASGILNILTGKNLGVWDGGSTIPSLLASAPFNLPSYVPPFAERITGFRLRFQQQGPVIKAEAFAQVWTGSQQNVPSFAYATCVASISDAAIPGVGMLGQGAVPSLNRIVGFTYFDISDVPSTGISGGDTYTVDGQARTGNRAGYSLVQGLRGNYLKPPPNATAVGAFVPFVLPLDPSPTNQDWSFSLSYNEQFTYAI